MSADELKPCPFCGNGMGDYTITKRFDNFRLFCPECGVCVERPLINNVPDLESIMRLIEAWNTRVDTSTSDKV